MFDEPIIKTKPLNDEQREMVNSYVRVRDWVGDSMEFEQHDERVAGWISDEK